MNLSCSYSLERALLIKVITIQAVFRTAPATPVSLVPFSSCGGPRATATEGNFMFFLLILGHFWCSFCKKQLNIS